MVPDADTDLNKAFLLADIADSITTKYYLTSDLGTKQKSDNSPVTKADLETEEALSRVVHETFGDTYLGEEAVRDDLKGRHWIVDPIDGTKNYMRGMPIWATLIGLADEQGPLASVITAPALGRRWWAAKGQGAWTRDVDGTTRRIHVSDIDTITEASLLHSSIFSWDKVPAGSEAMLSLLKKAWRNRSVGDFFGHMLVAEGAADASFEPNLKLWDIAALRLIITEAGGSIWDNGTAKTPADAPRITITSNGKLEDALKAVLAKE
jgi:histidinol-phosphatase